MSKVSSLLFYSEKAVLRSFEVSWGQIEVILGTNLQVFIHSTFFFQYLKNKIKLCESIVILIGVEEKTLRRKFNSWDFSIDDDRYIREGNEKHIFRVMLDRIPFKMDYLFEYLFKVKNKLSFQSLT